MRSPRARRLASAVSVSFVVMSPLSGEGLAHADEAGDKAQAQALFDDATRLLEEKKTAEACTKFAESRRLALGLGVTLYLADCSEVLGKTATALALFREAVKLAQARKDKREAVARDRAARLEEVTPTLLVRVPREVDGLAIRIDEVDLPRPQWGTRTHADPGEHTIVATAPGHIPFSTEVTLPAGRHTTNVDVPALEGDGSMPSSGGASAHGPTSAIDWTPRRIAGASVAAGGLVSVLVGGIFAVVAKSKLDSSNADGHCRPDNHCDADGLSLRDSANSAATVANVTVTLGLVALAAGAVIWFTAPKSRPASWFARP